MDQVLSSLPSRINYDRLNKNYGKYANDVKCDTLRDELKEAFPEILRNYTNMQKFCETFIDILSSFDTLKFHGPFDDNKCIIVKYWMYDKLFNYIKYEYVITDMSRFLDILSSIWKGYITDTNCNLDDAHMYSDETFNKIKDLFDYAQDYDTINRAIKLTNKECSDEYMRYLEKGVQTYNAIKQDCPNTSDKHYCVQFRKLKNIYEMDDLSNKICEIVNPALRISQEVFIFPDDDSETEEVTKGLGRGKQQMEIFEEEEEEERDKGDIGIARNGLKDQKTLSQMENIVQLEPGDPLALQAQQQAQSHTLSPSPFSTHDNLRKSVIPVSGGLLSLFMFYKFTPLGRRLRVFFSRNKLNSLNNNQVNDYLLTNKIEYGHPNSEINRHNIGYNPL